MTSKRKTIMELRQQHCSFTATFRQFKADSHCKFLHTYHMTASVTYWVESGTFDVMPLELKKMCNEFDGTLILAYDDPMQKELKNLCIGFDGLEYVSMTGCEGLAFHFKDQLTGIFVQRNDDKEANIEQVKISEHESNFGVA